MPNTFDGQELEAAACMCFFGFLRLGELVVPFDRSYDPAVLSVGDVKVDSRMKPT